MTSTSYQHAIDSGVYLNGVDSSHFGSQQWVIRGGRDPARSRHGSHQGSVRRLPHGKYRVTRACSDVADFSRDTGSSQLCACTGPRSFSASLLALRAKSEEAMQEWAASQSQGRTSDLPGTAPPQEEGCKSAQAILNLREPTRLGFVLPKFLNQVAK